MLAELVRHPHARAVLAPALANGHPSHAYLFHGPGGSGKRAAARALAAELLAEGSADPESARARVQSGAHPDLTWIVPSGAHEILVSDIAEPVIAASSRTPFEAQRRVFVLERVDELGDEAANRMLKTLEEPPSFVHLILLTDRVAEVLPTIRSRCQVVRFEATGPEELAAGLEGEGISPETALACVQLSLQDADRARELAGEEGAALRAAAEAYARAVMAGRSGTVRPWTELVAAARKRGDAAAVEAEARAQAELELTSRKERTRVHNDWNERGRRSRRRAQTGALDLELQLVALWFADLAGLAWDAKELVRHRDRMAQLAEDAKAPGGGDPRRLRIAIELVEDTRQRFELNVTEELACEALAYQLELALGS
jgi:DNA polymerase-3 subunit delta'